MEEADFQAPCIFQLYPDASKGMGITTPFHLLRRKMTKFPLLSASCKILVSSWRIVKAKLTGSRVHPSFPSFPLENSKYNS